MWKVALVNQSEIPRQLSLYTVFPFEDAPLMKGKSWYDAENEICYGDYFPHHHAFEQYEALKEQSTLNYLFSTHSPAGMESGERRFFGGNDVSKVPIAIQEGIRSGDAAVMDLPIGAFHHSFKLAPGKRIELGLSYGVEKSETAVQKLKMNYTVDSFDREKDAVIHSYVAIATNLSVQTPDKALNGFVNHWLPKQIIFQSRKNRLSGAFPIRNQLQDCMGYSLLDPKAAADYLLTRVQLQKSDGSLRQWWAEGDTDNHSLCQLDFKDAGVWLILCSIIITNQSGSSELLKRKVPFSDSSEAATLFEHLMLAARYLAKNRGNHGLCLFGDGDWTDPINGAGRKGIGESTWTTCAFGAATQMLHEVAIEIGERADAKWLSELNASLHSAVDQHCWDGNWFITGFNDESVKFGCSEDQEGKIFLNSQTWAIIAGYVSEERIQKTMESIRRLETQAGTLVSWPSFTKWNPTWGRISLKQAGTTENGSIYCHASMFKAYAESCLGQPDGALDEILRILPTNAKNPPSHNTQAPIFLPNYYFGLTDSSEFGISSCNHHTGTAPWMLWVIVESILGIRATHQGLEINPKLPSSWPKVEIVRQFRNSRYAITLINRGSHSKPEILVDGISHDSQTLPCGNAHYQVTVTT